MRKQIMEDAAYEVATQVRAVEDSIEAALIEIAELQAHALVRLPGGGDVGRTHAGNATSICRWTAG